MTPPRKTIRRPPSPEEPALSRQAKGRGGQGGRTKRARKTVQEVRTDSRMWPLLERYCKLAKVKLIPRGADLYDMKLPLSERAHFGERASVRVALSLEALERDPDAEMAVLGSPFLAHLLEAIRTRAGRLSLGMIPPPVSKTPGLRPGSAKGTDLSVPVRNGTARRRKSQLATHTVGRLLARIVLRAGAVVEETVIESALIDLATGARADDQVTAQFAALEARALAPADPGDLPDAVPVPARPPAEMLQLLLGDLREQSAVRVAARQAGAEQGVAVELERLDRYFASVLADKTDPDDVRTIKALHERRRAEEMRRHQVMAIVHPLQLSDAQVLMQRVEWEIRSARGVRARFAAQRPIAGSAEWILACPQCGRSLAPLGTGSPAELVVCVHEEGEDQRGHCACETCATRCSVCASDFCADHGIASCRVDEQPACEQHARMCPSCRMAHCTAHEGVCADGEHPACSACLEACGSCGRIVCNAHAERVCRGRTDSVLQASAPGGWFGPPRLRTTPRGVRSRAGGGLRSGRGERLSRVRQDRLRSAFRRVRLLRPPSGKRSWRMARDRTHVVLELNVGWRRRTVFTLPHGASEPDGVVTH